MLATSFEFKPVILVLQLLWGYRFSDSRPGESEMREPPSNASWEGSHAFCAFGLRAGRSVAHFSRSPSYDCAGVCLKEKLASYLRCICTLKKSGLSGELSAYWDALSPLGMACFSHQPALIHFKTSYTDKRRGAGISGGKARIAPLPNDIILLKQKSVKSRLRRVSQGPELVTEPLEVENVVLRESLEEQVAAAEVTLT